MLNTLTGLRALNNISKISLYQKSVLKSRAHLHTNVCSKFPRRTPHSKDISAVNIESPASISLKYKIFKDADSTIILDSTEFDKDNTTIIEEFDEFEGLSLERGVNGVYEIEELVQILHRENALNIFVALVPVEKKFVEHICIVTARSVRHMSAIAQFIKKLYKRKRHINDELAKIEGKTSRDWMAIDLGNIALHIFVEEAREIYDLEQLWSVGPEFDSECNKQQNDIISLLERHSIHLDGLKPAK